MEPFPRARRMPASEVDVADLELDRLRRAQPAGVHRLQQRAVAQRRRLGAARLAQQLGDLVARQHLRQLAAGLRGAQVGRRVGAERADAPQVPVEGAQAGDLALQRRGRGGRASLPAAGELVREGGQVGVRDVQRIVLRAREPLAVLQEVGAVGLERVARKAALELEVGEKVEQQVLERLRCGRRSDDGHGPPCFAAEGGDPARRNAPFSRAGGPPASGARSASWNRGSPRSSRPAVRAGAPRS